MLNFRPFVTQVYIQYINCHYKLKHTVKKKYLYFNNKCIILSTNTPWVHETKIINSLKNESEYQNLNLNAESPSRTLLHSDVCSTRVGGL